MQVPHQSSIDREAVFRTTVDRIKSTLMLSDQDMMDYFGLTTAEYQGFQNKSQTITQSQLDRFANQLSLDPFQIMKGEVDYFQLYKRLRDQDISLPERYTHHKKSRIKTAQNILSFLDRNHPGFSDIIANKLQLSWAALTSPSEQVNARLIDDIYNIMGQIGFKDKNLLQCGIDGAKQYYLMPEFGSALWSASSPKEILEIFFTQQIKYIDGTWHYHIVELTDHSCTIRVTTPELTQDIYQTNKFGCDGQCQHRLGFGLGLLEAGANIKATYSEPKCIHRGDDFCQLEMYY